MVRRIEGCSQGLKTVATIPPSRLSPWLQAPTPSNWTWCVLCGGNREMVRWMWMASMAKDACGGDGMIRWTLMAGAGGGE